MTLFSHLAALALIALSAVPTHADVLARHGHDAVAKHRRDASSSSTCKPRPTTSSTSAAPTTIPSSTSTSAPSPTTSPTSAAPTTTPSPTSTTSAPSPTSTSNKKFCLAWGTDDTYLPNFALSNVNIYYNWSPLLPTQQLSDLGIDGMAMLWGWDQASQFQQTVVKGYARYAAGPNEPDQQGQANMSPSEAVDLWMTYINPLETDYTLVSPACTDSDDGLAWYQEFFPSCWSAGCHIDILAVHCYNTDPGTIIDFVTNLYELFKLPIMITEFADQNFSGTGGQADMDEVWDFAGQMRTFIEQTDWMYGACPYGIMDYLNGVDSDNSLINTDGYPSPLGYFYFD